MNSIGRTSSSNHSDGDNDGETDVALVAQEDEAPAPRASPRVAQALGVYRNMAACHARAARRAGPDESDALAAALMLPCYQRDFCVLALALTSAEARELRHALDAFRASAG
ncbi:hypothetical protein M2165_002664 [Variovorax sp. TBS-050B]|uniref:hypothetical protein n=1 Tax=Variovorax sp. TBS-050B TaxID=2940551 RepID=UPI002474D014|nr:hypothetical protein [Variovorax sp. TBS-050B]MDH6592775.1 hypothetical protein [Variovorax sp. TBS-050B]